MTDARALADEAVVYLDRLGAVILDDIGDGPPPGDLAATAAAARDAIARLGVSALTQLAGLVAGVADSMVAGSTDWSPSLGGTLMAAVDDLRHLVGRADQFTDEDSEHLHHRAAELSVYVRAPTGDETAPDVVAPVAEVSPVDAPADAPEAAAEPVPATPPADSESSMTAPTAAAASQPATSTAPEPAPSAAPSEALATRAPEKGVVAISQLFYSDQGPHIVSGGVPKAAGDKSELLGRGIEALESLLANPFAVPVSMGVTAVVPVETLLYSGRAALERAAEIRAQIRTAGGTATPATLDEIYDLIGLALKD